MQKWRCENCGYEYEGDLLEFCPSCNKSCGFVDATNYVPESFTGKEGGVREMTSMEIKIYCDPFCPSCKDIADFLKAKGVNFEFVNVDKDENAAKEVVTLSGQDKLPVIKIGDKVIAPPIDKEKLLEVINGES